MYGTQAAAVSGTSTTMFENDVNMYGTQAILHQTENQMSFENDVNMYGTQAIRFLCRKRKRLRIMYI